MSEQPMSDELRRALTRMDNEYAPLGRVERSQQWRCEDGWIIEYTTTKVIGGPHDGKFLVQVFKPVGKGARKGKAREWVADYARAFSKRNLAKARAVELYRKHSPLWDKKNPREAK